MQYTKIIFIMAGIFAYALITKANIVDSNGFLRNDDGSLVQMTEYQAEGIDAYGDQVSSPVCPAGTHINTLQELIQLMNPTALSEKPSAGALKFYSEDGSVLYYSKTGYQTPDTDLGKTSVWSSSISGPNANGYLFDGKTGAVLQLLRFGFKGAIRCVNDLM